MSKETRSEKELNVENDIIKNYNYDEINKLLEENTMKNYLDEEKLELGNVLLTGVTGFLGIHLVDELYNNTNKKIYCLIRKINKLEKMT